MSLSSLQLGSARAPHISAERRSGWPLYVVPCCRFTSECQRSWKWVILPHVMTFHHFLLNAGAKPLLQTEVDPRVKHPYLYISPSEDPSVPLGLASHQEALCDDITTKTIKTGHWIFEQDPKGAVNLVVEWGKEKGLLWSCVSQLARTSCFNREMIQFVYFFVVLEMCRNVLSAFHTYYCTPQKSNKMSRHTEGSVVRNGGCHITFWGWL